MTDITIFRVAAARAASMAAHYLRLHAVSFQLDELIALLVNTARPARAPPAPISISQEQLIPTYSLPR